MSAPFSANNAIRVVGKLLVSCIVLPCIFLILLEAVARITDIGYPSTLFIEETTADGAWLRPNYRVGYRFFPAKLARKPLPEIMPAIKPADRLRIFVLGESAARGEQLADFSFSRMLEAALQNGSLQKKVEVINTGIPAINSWVLRDFAREIMNYQPDLIVVYAGHNEFIGPYGPGNVFGLAGNRNAALIGIWASSLRLIQALKPDKLPAELARGWQGLEMFMKNTIKPGSSAISDCLENWRKNLDDIFATAAAAKIPVIWCRVPVNQKDCPPFISDESGFLPETTALIEQIKKYSENNEHQKVLQNIDKIRSKVKNHALTDYLEGSARLALGDPKSAGQCFKNALNNDCFRVRTTDIFNDAAAEAAKRHQAHIADIEAAFIGNCGNGIIGADLVYDHVHLTLKGHYIAAAGIFSSIKNIQPALMQSMPDKFPDLEEIKKYTGFTDQDEIDNLTHIISSTQEPPFTSQFMHNSRLKQFNMQIETLKKSRKDLATNIALISDAAIRQPFNWAIQNRLAMLLRHDSHAARKIFERSLALNPFNIDTLNNFGQLMLSINSEAEAEKLFRKSLAIAPDFAKAHFNLGILYAGKVEHGDKASMQKAVWHYRQAIETDPGMKTAWRNLANLYFRAAQYEDALSTYQQANKSGLNDLYLAMGEGNCLMQLKKNNEAHIAYAQAVKSFPDSPLPLYSLAMACEKLQLFSDASNYLQKAAQFDHLPAFYKLFELHFAQKISLSEQQTADLSDKACRLTDFTDPWLMQILAASYLNTGKKNEAAGILHRALKLAEQQNKKSLADEITTNIKLCTEN